MLASEKHYGEASLGLRLGTFLLDGLFLFLGMVTLGVVYAFVAAAAHLPIPSDLTLRVVALVLATVYYALFEWLLGRTLGKMIFGTRVIRDRGGRPGLKAVLVRTLVRFIPAEPLSFLWGEGWHDRWSSTTVVRTRPGKWQQDAMEV